MSEREAQAQAGDRREITLPDGVLMAFRFIPRGEFRMGQRGEHLNEEPAHRVKVDDQFWLGERPVTQVQLATWRPSHENRFPGHPDHPAERVSWEDAQEYCRWLTAQCAAQFPAAGLTAQLPDEAHWEYACRAGTETDYYSGDGAAALAEVGWFEDNSENTTHPVGTKPANAWGLRDMHGNVWEWCEDVWDARAYRKRTDGWSARPWTIAFADEDAVYLRKEDRDSGGPIRVLRGGAWDDSAGFCRYAVRVGDWPSVRYGSFGFRVCLARKPPAGDKQAEAEPGAGAST